MTLRHEALCGLSVNQKKGVTTVRTLTCSDWRRIKRMLMVSAVMLNTLQTTFGGGEERVGGEYLLPEPQRAVLRLRTAWCRQTSRSKFLFWLREKYGAFVVA